MISFTFHKKWNFLYKQSNCLARINSTKLKLNLLKDTSVKLNVHADENAKPLFFKS